MDLEWTFSVKYDDLEELSSTNDERHIIRLAERLRAFFGEADSIAQLANARFGLNTRFYVTRAALQFAASGSDGIDLNIEFFPGPSPNHRFHVDMAIDRFREIPVLAFEGKPYTVHNIVIGAANVAGGVHARAKPNNRWLVPLCEQIFKKDRATGLSALKCIASYVVDAYSPLRKAFVNPYAIAQARRSRQPLFVMDGLFHVMEFDGNAYLEDVIRITPSEGLFFYIIVAPGDAVAERRFITDFGIRHENAPRFSLSSEGERLLFSYSNEGQQAEVAANIAVRRFSFIVTRCEPFEDGVRLSLSIDGIKSEQEFSGMKLPTQFEGKKTVGADIYGKNGAIFQMTEFGMWPRNLLASDEAKLIQNARENNAVPRGWVIAKGKGLVAKLYNQALDPKKGS